MGQSSITIYNWRIFAILCQRVVNKLQKLGESMTTLREKRAADVHHGSAWEQLRGIPWYS